MKSWDSVPDSDVVVMLAGKEVKKKDVPLGKEFVQDGRLLQTSLATPVDADHAVSGDRFKFGDIWCAKTATRVYALAPNSPFGRVSAKGIDIRFGQRVRMLIIDDRGPA